VTARVFALPDLGEGLADAELVRWLVGRGDVIAVDQPIAEVETAKSVVEVPSPFAGVVVVLHGEAGETIAVGAPLVEVAVDVAVEGEVEVEDGGNGGMEAEPGGTGSGHVLVGYGTTGSAVRRRRSRVGVGIAPAAAASVPAAVRAAAPIPVVSPVVRALARARGVDLVTLHASGSGGVVTRADVEAAAAQPPAAQPPAAPPAAAPPAATPPAAAPPPAADARTGLALRSSEPFSRFRRTVGETMARSRAEIPEATVWVDVDATDLWNGRRRLVVDGRSPSFLSFVARFALAALARRPELAGRVTADGSGLETFEGVNLGVAVDTPRGLMVPVVRRADLRSVRELDVELDRLADAARAGSLGPAELAGSTFTINNYGSLGVDGSAAIINHPEVAILGIGRVLERPWVVDGAIVPRRIAQLSLVFDHRVVDGGAAAGFLREIADAVESPLRVLAEAIPAAPAAAPSARSWA
jgi:2-oxoisovalerate dehydrogenase E2 component (dihydrolipoyl transacylase)